MAEVYARVVEGASRVIGAQYFKAPITGDYWVEATTQPLGNDTPIPGKPGLFARCLDATQIQITPNKVKVAEFNAAIGVVNLNVLSLLTTTIPAGGAPGALASLIIGKTPGSVITFTPNDGRLTITALSEALIFGLSATTAGTSIGGSLNESLTLIDGTVLTKSSPVTIVFAAAPAPTVVPDLGITITGLPRVRGVTNVGEVLTSSPPIFDGWPRPTDYAISWEINGVTVPGASDPWLEIAPSMVGGPIPQVVYGVTNRVNTRIAKSAVVAGTVGAQTYAFTRWVAPNAMGTGTGTSVANAAAITNINNVIAQAANGEAIGILADVGTYTITTEIIINQGGAAGLNKRVMGVNSDGSAGFPDIQSNRFDWTANPDPDFITNIDPAANRGVHIFTLRNGASYLTFQRLKATKLMSLVHPSADDLNITDIRVDNIIGYNVSRIIDNDNGTVNGLKFRGSKVTGFSKSCYRFSANTNNIEGDSHRLDAHRMNRDSWSTGVAMVGNSHTALYRNFITHDCYDDRQGLPNKYWNGDGFDFDVDEDVGTATYDIEVEDAIVYRNTDSGIDSKAANLRISRFFVKNCKRNFRLWGLGTGDVTATDLWSEGPVLENVYGLFAPCHLGCYGRADVLLNRFTASGTGTLFQLEGGLSVLRTKNLTYDAALVPTLEPGNVIIAADVNDTTAPVFATSGTRAVAEYQDFSLQLMLTAPDPQVRWYIVPGDDGAKFTVSSTGLLTLPAQTFANPNHAPLYKCRVRARDGARNDGFLDIALSITDVVEVASSRYISATPAGDKSGSSVANAAALSSINSQAGQAAAGGKVVFLTTGGTYDVSTLASPIQITSSGAQGAPITFRGEDGNGNLAKAVFSAGRATDTILFDAGNATGASNPNVGKSVFEISNASHLNFQGIHGTNANIFMRCLGTCDDITFGDQSFLDTATIALLPTNALFDTFASDYRSKVAAIRQKSLDYTLTSAQITARDLAAVDFTNVTRGFDVGASATGTAVLTNCKVVGGKGAGTSRGFFRFRNQSTHIYMQDWFGDALKQREKQDNKYTFCITIENSGVVLDFVINRGKANGAGSQEGGAGEYYNGDGMTGELLCNGAIYLNIEASDNTDGGIETKAKGVTLIGVKSRLQRRLTRLWGVADCHYLDFANTRAAEGGNQVCVYAVGIVRVWSATIADAATVTGSAIFQTEAASGQAGVAYLWVNTDEVTVSNTGVSILYNGTAGPCFGSSAAADTANPAFSTSGDVAVVEASRGFYTPAVSGSPCHYELVGGADAALIRGRTYIFSIAPQFVATPVDADANGTYVGSIRAISPTRKVATQTVTFTVNAAPPATHDTVARLNAIALLAPRRQQAITTFMDGMRDAGILTRTQWMHCPRMPTDAYARVNWFGPRTDDIRPNGTNMPDFIANEGYSGTSSKFAYVGDTPAKWTKAVAEKGAMAIWMRPGSAFGPLIGMSDFGMRSDANGGLLAYASTPAQYVAPTAFPGFAGFNRDGSDWRLYKAGALASSGTSTPDDDIAFGSYRFGSQQDAAGGPCAPIAFEWVGTTLTPAMWVQFNSLVTSLMTAFNQANIDTDDVAPTITSPSSVTIQENNAWSMTLTANEPVTWSIVAGADGGQFTLTGSTLSSAARDYEAPTDGAPSNSYVVTLRATDTAGNFTDQTFTQNIQDVDDAAGDFRVLRLDFSSMPVGSVVTDSSPKARIVTVAPGATVSNALGTNDVRLRLSGTGGNANLTMNDSDDFKFPGKLAIKGRKLRYDGTGTASSLIVQQQSTTTQNFNIGRNAAGNMIVDFSITGVSTGSTATTHRQLVSTTVLAANTDYDFLIRRDASNNLSLLLCLAGGTLVQEATTTLIGTTYDSVGSLYVGSYSANNSKTVGYLGGLEIVNGADVVNDL